MGLLLAVATALATVGSVRVAGHRVNSAADLGALAAARLALIDPEGACAKAAELAIENGVELTDCKINEDVADVWTELSISLPLLGSRTVRGRSRAGPAETIPLDDDRSSSPERRSLIPIGTTTPPADTKAMRSTA